MCNYHQHQQPQHESVSQSSTTNQGANQDLIGVNVEPNVSILNFGNSQQGNFSTTHQVGIA